MERREEEVMIKFKGGGRGGEDMIYIYIYIISTAQFDSQF